MRPEIRFHTVESGAQSVSLGKRGSGCRQERMEIVDEMMKWESTEEGFDSTGV